MPESEDLFQAVDCPLCQELTDQIKVSGPDHRKYYLCEKCFLIFSDPATHLSQLAEEQHYQTHENGIQHEGYVKFLMRAVSPALPWLLPGMVGLDFGCGPVPTLSLLLDRAGYRMDDYDPIYFPELRKGVTYDFIFATECFEHFFYPAQELARLGSLLQEGGLLVVMTEKWKEKERFAKWYYAKDPTHVVFYHERTFAEICRRFGFTQRPSPDERVVLLVKNPAQKNPVNS